MTIKEYDSRWRKLFIIAFESYTNGGSFIFIIWGVAFLFVSHVINQREDADALRNEFNIDGNQVLFIRASIPDFYNFKKELTRGCNIKLVKNPFLFNTESTRNLYSDKVEDYIQYDSKTCICQSQFHTDKFYQYQYQPDKIPSNNNSNTSLNSMNSENIKLKSINSIQKAINNSSKLEKILIATPINLSD
ncbi:hypothetical protein LY90DRAFT_668333 [Neocallimastix californiae]|uniref:Uncharacterized protein n=1 Tax=Neocallimastix californiae TaxID=1754190 RepID=A0A1Y2DU42_9FUNG|nr:hypothetical protein LY90DRAFT_668333 [Neocallimastix californiae]|eukprot:ORY62793.1 hypothetical protein LY90DRAFT_668333 [Neocallimastix californiae]